MKSLIKTISLICFIIAFALICCTSADEEPEKMNNLEGVWEYVSGEYSIGDSTIVIPGETYPFIKSYKFISKTRSAVLTQDTSKQMFRCETGPYRITEDTYVEYFEIIIFVNQ